MSGNLVGILGVTSNEASMQKILIVDDDPQMQKLYSRLFSMEEFQVEVAEDGVAGVDRVRSFSPDVILLDVMMKKMNGLQALAAFKSSPTSRDIPVVVLSNISDARVVNDAKSKGATQYVVKSETEPQEMVEIVKEVLSNAGGAGGGFM
jgi:CheY-like chemotaxis protein